MVVCHSFQILLRCFYQVTLFFFRPTRRVSRVNFKSLQLVHSSVDSNLVQVQKDFTHWFVSFLFFPFHGSSTHRWSKSHNKKVRSRSYWTWQRVTTYWKKFQTWVRFVGHCIGEETKRKDHPPNTKHNLHMKEGGPSQATVREVREERDAEGGDAVESHHHPTGTVLPKCIYCQTTPKLNQNKQTGRAGSQLQNVVSGWLGRRTSSRSWIWRDSRRTNKSCCSRTCVNTRSKWKPKRRLSSLPTLDVCDITKQNQIKSNYDRILWWENPQCWRR